MCTTCGCGNALGGGAGHDHDHDHGHDHGHGPADAGPRLIQLEQDILEANDHVARVNRERFEAAGVLAVNLVSSPGAGKTTLLVASIAAGLGPIAVIEGDQQTALDADRIRAAGAPAFQINTGRACHLDASMVAHAADHLGLPGRGGYLFIENVGNLVCPAAFDLGEAARVLLVSVTEGDDKPLKYPDIFASATLAVVTKIDLLPHVRFDLAACLEHARRINPAIETIALSSESGEGMEAWFRWLTGRQAKLRSAASAAAASAAAASAAAASAAAASAAAPSAAAPSTVPPLA